MDTLKVHWTTKGGKKELAGVGELDLRFKDLLPPLSGAEREALERSIVAEGCRDPLVVWHDPDTRKPVLVDGHNRAEICDKHTIPVRVSRLDEAVYSTSASVEQWIIKNQLGRRNLTDAQREEFIGRLHAAEKKAVGNSEAAKAKKGQNGVKNQLVQIELIDNNAKNAITTNTIGINNPDCMTGLRKPNGMVGTPSKEMVAAFKNAADSTAKKIAKEQGVSESYVKRAEKFANAVSRVEKVSPEAARKIRAELSVLPRGEVHALADAPEEKVKEAARAIEEDKPIAKPPAAKPSVPATAGEVVGEVLASALRAGAPKPAAPNAAEELCAVLVRHMGVDWVGSRLSTMCKEVGLGANELSGIRTGHEPAVSRAKRLIDEMAERVKLIGNILYGEPFDAKKIFSADEISAIVNRLMKASFAVEDLRQWAVECWERVTGKVRGQGEILTALKYTAQEAADRAARHVGAGNQILGVIPAITAIKKSVDDCEQAINDSLQLKGSTNK